MAYDFKVEIAEADATPTPAIWNMIPLNALQEENQTYRNALVEEFNGGLGNWLTYQTDAAAYVKAGSASGIQMTTGNGDNDELVLQATRPFVIPVSGYVLALEARIKPSTVTTEQLGYFLGLAEPSTALGADGLLTDDDADIVATTDAVGIHSRCDDTTEINIGYNVSGQTKAEVNNIATGAAATWVKVGCLIDFRPGGPVDAQRLTAYYNGTAQSTYLANSVVIGDTFPSEITLYPTIGIKCGTAAAYTLDIDWFRVALMKV